MDEREIIYFEQTYRQILTELSEVLGQVDPHEVEELIAALMEAEKIFTTGVGRVLLVSKVFAMRLMHLGFRAHVVGGVTTPSIGPSDLLIASSGSGETLTTYNVARMARDHGARVAAITVHPASSIGRLAQVVVRIPGPTKIKGEGEIRSAQPMTNLFDQSLYLFFDTVSILLQKRLGRSEEDMWRAHANLE